MCEEGSKTDEKDGSVTENVDDSEENSGRRENGTFPSRGTISVQSPPHNEREIQQKTEASDLSRVEQNSRLEVKSSKHESQLSMLRDERRVDTKDDNAPNKNNKDIPG